MNCKFKPHHWKQYACSISTNIFKDTLHYKRCAVMFSNYIKSRFEMQVQHPTLNIVPGKKLCSNCTNKFQGLLSISIEASSSSDSKAEEAIQVTSSRDDSLAD